jgi:hypothetical protein
MQEALFYGFSLELHARRSSAAHSRSWREQAINKLF